MANVKSAPVQNEVSGNGAIVAAPVASAPVAKTEAQLIAERAAQAAKARAELIGSLTLAELLTAARQSVRWVNVIDAASKLGQAIEDGDYAGEKPTVIARKIGSANPTLAMDFRVILGFYCAAKHGANPQQLAELASKLPDLRTNGALKDKAISFGGIVLPPIVGEI